MPGPAAGMVTTRGGARMTTRSRSAVSPAGPQRQGSDPGRDPDRARGADRKRKPERARGPDRARDPERPRGEILDVALSEFARNGYSGARVDEIAAKTRTTKRMIYYYFTNKEQQIGRASCRERV